MWKNQQEIKSESSSRKYTIAELFTDGISQGWGCSCPGWKSRGKCKHLTTMGLPSCRRESEPAPKGLGSSDNSTFSDEAYAHYDTRYGYGTPEEWIRIAEGMASGRSRYKEYKPPPREYSSFFDLKMEAMRIFGFTEMPADVKDVVRAMRRLAMKLHPDMGGDAREFDKMMQAYERLLRYYPK